MSPLNTLVALLEKHRRTLGTLIVVVLAMNSLVLVRHVIAPDEGSRAEGAATFEPSEGLFVDPETGEVLPSDDPTVVGSPTRPGVTTPTPGRTGLPRTPSRPGVSVSGTIPPGVDDDEIVVAYYWKGDRTMASPYLHGSGAEGNVDEAEAFRHLVAYINKYADGGATFMGFPFNLHGRKIKPVVLEAGQYPDTYAATAERLAREVEPFVAISSHGSLSAYICPRLAQAGIHNLATYDLGGKGGSLLERTNGYCMPSGLAWESQVELSVAYLAKQAATTRYQATTSQDRVYGVLYAEYPGLVDEITPLVKRLRDSGLDIPDGAVLSLAADLTTAQQQAQSRVLAFRRANVNTLIIPDAGAPLNFTHAAQAQGYNPDYFVWPCSGQDSIGMVRLYNAGQWARAEGLSCYDDELAADVTNTQQSRQTEWYRQYREMAGTRNEPPAPTPIVYQSLLPLLVGVTNAGPDLTVESFRAGMAAMRPYRYNAIEGRTTDPSNVLITVGRKDGSVTGDVARVRWSNTARTGGSNQGNYVFLDNRRYARASAF